MKSTGISRPVDRLGRIVVPSELRRALGIREGDKLEVLIEGHRIVVQKSSSACILCSRTNDLIEFRARVVCRSCAGALGQLTGVEIRLDESPQAAASSPASGKTAGKDS